MSKNENNPEQQQAYLDSEGRAWEAYKRNHENLMEEARQLFLTSSPKLNLMVQ